MKRLTQLRFLPLLLLLILISSALVIGIANAQSPHDTVPEAPRLIAHAGGDIYGVRMTNSRQALDRSMKKASD